MHAQPAPAWEIGTYTPSENFRKIPLMACVYRDNAEMTVIATTGPASDLASIANAVLMSASRELLVVALKLLHHCAQSRNSPLPAEDIEFAQAAVAKATAVHLSIG